MPRSDDLGIDTRVVADSQIKSLAEELNSRSRVDRSHAVATVKSVQRTVARASEASCFLYICFTIGGFAMVIKGLDLLPPEYHWLAAPIFMPVAVLVACTLLFRFGLPLVAYLLVVDYVWSGEPFVAQYLLERIWMAGLSGWILSGLASQALLRSIRWMKRKRSPQ